jgi:hypothetical protein
MAFLTCPVRFVGRNLLVNSATQYTRRFFGFIILIFYILISAEPRQNDASG